MLDLDKIADHWQSFIDIFGFHAYEYDLESEFDFISKNKCFITLTDPDDDDRKYLARVESGMIANYELYWVYRLLAKQTSIHFCATAISIVNTPHAVFAVIYV
jgi:hypothetical protein